ncbi:hypothetical protein [Streptomyces rubellomurinus]|uniref:Uncharacterized protein n=1 Tax=Streptomyces rubellomurinus (strain ATCC 31215) TaxID=359131 RepID=A0A0F2TH18_STRR3|nr:hypothetical protein [Streptomyces rubellomurinus]KJS60992.1 hypothetical protein VM95_17730 [Streptomyces rubellomurinus]
MATHTAHGDTSHLSFWRHVREFAVPPAMIETATARRLSGDWAGALTAARVDLDFRIRDVVRAHGREFTDHLLADLHRLAPDLLRWHLPRTAPDGLLRPGLTVPLARYPGERPVALVVRTPPAWADFGQRIGLALWDGSANGGPPLQHPHPHPSRRFRFDLHRHLWDAGRSGEFAARAGTGGPSGLPAADTVAAGLRCAVDRWGAEAGLLLRAEGRPAGPVAVRLGRRRMLLLEPGAAGVAAVRPVGDAREARGLPLLPDAATWVAPDLDLLRSGTLGPELLHPLVARALAPGHARGPVRPGGAGEAGRAGGFGGPGLVDCRGAVHRIGLVDGVLAPLDHAPAELRRERLLIALSGTPLPCLRAVERAHRRPHELAGLRERLDHGDVDGALAAVEAVLGPQARLREGPLRDALAAIEERRSTYERYRAGLATPGPDAVAFRRRDRRPKDHWSHPR